MVSWAFLQLHFLTFVAQSDFSQIRHLLIRLLRDFVCGSCCKMVEAMGVDQLSPHALTGRGGFLSQSRRGSVRTGRFSSQKSNEIVEMTTRG